MNEQHKEIFLKDYTPPSHEITKTHLIFDIQEEHTTITNQAHFIPSGNADQLILNGIGLELLEVRLDGELLDQSKYTLTDTHLTIASPQTHFALEVKTRIEPHKNKTLEGLYKSRNLFCTQNEPEGFRRMTYHLDRPDVMSEYTTTIIADKKKYPVLLSNGNKVSEKNHDERHEVTWHDPFKKPAYLFALVAGSLVRTEDAFTTQSGRKIPLHIYTDKGNEHRTRHALDSLKRAMKWDEDVFGLEYDLDLFMIVAVDDFNFGAMENKGLNIFNSSAVLADPASTTDENYNRIEGIVAHEYFHNWTGNRVTCRDWFQITLKEGLTVFRDQQYSADQVGKTVMRISDVNSLRDFQFPEDAGPNAHAIRPPSYIQINNFYTYTVYEKGAEIIRMVHTLIGEDHFKKGITKYFELYDGQAVTTDDFIQAMSLASGKDLTQFKRWYKQVGTPHVQVEEEFQNGTYSLTLKQSLSYPSGQEIGPLHIPIRFGLLNSAGEELSAPSLLELTNEVETFTFSNLKEKPTPSLFRHFSAPVKIQAPLTKQDDLLLFSFDQDEFNRYEAGQRLLKPVIIDHLKTKGSLELDDAILSVYRSLLSNEAIDPAFCAKMFGLPSLVALADQAQTWDYKKLHQAREGFVHALVTSLENEFLNQYQRLKETDYSRDRQSIAKRKLKNVCLNYLSRLEKYQDLLNKQYIESDNMTDSLTALNLLCQKNTSERDKALKAFYDRWKEDPLVMNKYFMVQASATHDQVLKEVKQLQEDPKFDKQNPNKIRSLYAAFARNLPVFHNGGKEGYQFIADKIIEIDQFNPMAASGLASTFNDYPKLPEPYQSMVGDELRRILDQDLSSNAYEILNKIYRSVKQ